MTEHAHIRYTKWDGSLHWHFDAEIVDRDRHGTWVVVPPGGTYRRGDEPPRVDDFGFVVFVPDGGWWTAYFNAVPRGSNRHLVYVDINTAPVWNGTTATMIDLDLDVTFAPQGTARVIDEDEFDDHRIRWSYPPDVVDRVRTTAARIATDIDLRREPFGIAGPNHVATTLGWSHGTVTAAQSGQLHARLDHRLAATALPVDARVAIAGDVLPARAVAHGSDGVSLECSGAAHIAAGTPVSVWIDPTTGGFDVA